QMRAERERRSVVALSEGEREAKINLAEGEKQEVIKQSEAQKVLQINEAEGKSKEIELIATATADGLRRVAAAINEDGGSDAVNLRIAEQYVREFGNLARTNNTLILPSNVSDVGGTVAALAKVLDATKGGGGVAAPPPFPKA
ncbi:MAG: band-7 C-terminal domain-containing protein, partial [Opitutaceae bacterium]|nr:band-7 C-terminal domain-containing protein [Opitutaceae bacterium]